MMVRDEIGAHQQRERQRVGEIRQLIQENQRIYADLNAIRFKLYEVSIEQDRDV